MSDERWVTFLSDYGLQDHLVGVCKGSIARIAPKARIIDVCHQVTPQDVRLGAAMLAEAVSYLPTGVHLALIDPFRAADAPGVAIQCADGSILVCPNNGVGSEAWEELGGVSAARVLNNPAFWHENPSRSFRGRDVFAPVAAHLANGVSFAEIGDEISSNDLVVFEPELSLVHGDHVHGNIRMVDHFGNLSLSLDPDDLATAGIQQGDVVELRISGRTIELPFARHFGDVPEGRIVLCEDSFQTIAVAVNMGRADRQLHGAAGEPVVVSRVHRAPAKESQPIGML